MHFSQPAVAHVAVVFHDIVVFSRAGERSKFLLVGVTCTCDVYRIPAASDPVQVRYGNVQETQMLASPTITAESRKLVGAGLGSWSKFHDGARSRPYKRAASEATRRRGAEKKTSRGP